MIIIFVLDRQGLDRFELYIFLFKDLNPCILKGRFPPPPPFAHLCVLVIMQNDKIDPEKLKKDREELEKRQREGGLFVANVPLDN